MSHTQLTSLKPDKDLREGPLFTYIHIAVTTTITPLQPPPKLETPRNQATKLDVQKQKQDCIHIAIIIPMPPTQTQRACNQTSKRTEEAGKYNSHNYHHPIAITTKTQRARNRRN